jgi:putative addiction module component (TIGR02574 family)
MSDKREGIRISPVLRALGIDRLSAAERIALAQEILDSVLAEQLLPPLSEARLQELRVRLTAHEADPSGVVPWEQIEAEAMSRFQR